ncbi:hypothetical protein HNQ93_004232 [Hymenobacter luteus]|uniref:Uncharacterized protein n=2 Tax=Hymenobacter TaxID=89966 RepID=A0A7W9T5V9_9BACT|nr:hypothetical protein [Hymenobacter luteus]MBB4603605.1 hypothetical protein [Hymenobacter latericoloratus]MBB6061353.1 hypothetical protein [Hymenobacter luteus]
MAKALIGALFNIFPTSKKAQLNFQFSNVRYEYFPLLLLVAACSSEPTDFTSAVPAASEPAVTSWPADTVQTDYSRAVENLPGSPY